MRQLDPPFDTESSPLVLVVEDDPDTRHFRFTKTYDGTGGAEHDVEYSGDLNRERSASGSWNIGDLKGRFTLQNLRLDKNVLDTVQ